MSHSLFHVVRRYWISGAGFALLLLAPAFAQETDSSAATPSIEGALVYIISPQNGQNVQNPVRVQFGLNGMGIAPAGIDVPGTGHHHLLVDTSLPPLDQPIPTDDHHLHFGKGQTETELNLPPGRHELQLLFGDYLHRPHQPVMVSERVVITVE